MKVRQMLKQRREYFRLEYPIFCRPTLCCGNKSFDVLDISEYGVRFKTKDINSFMLGKKLGARLIFKDDDKHSCDGKIIRLNSEEVAVNLTTPIPLYKIRSEHLYLIQNARHTMAV